MPSLFFVIALTLQSILFWYEFFYPCFFVISICMKCLFHSLIFNLCVFSSEVSFLHVAYWRVRFLKKKNIQSATLFLLTGAFSPLTFKVVIDRYILVVILLLVFWLLSKFSVHSFFFWLPPLWFDDFLWWYACVPLFLGFVCVLQVLICGYHGGHTCWPVTIATRLNW